MLGMSNCKVQIIDNRPEEEKNKIEEKPVAPPEKIVPVDLKPLTNVEDFWAAVAQSENLVIVEYFASWVTACNEIGSKLPEIAG